MPWYDKAEMLTILSNPTVTHHYTEAEFSAAQDKHIGEQAAGGRRSRESPCAPLSSRPAGPQHLPVVHDDTECKSPSPLRYGVTGVNRVSPRDASTR
jgi:hypothetical protein